MIKWSYRLICIFLIKGWQIGNQNLMQTNVKVIHLGTKNQQISYSMKDSDGFVEQENTALEKDFGDKDGQKTESHGAH